MRLHAITLEGFRGFVRRATVPLDADVILCHGPNGAGKTSLLDGILWALSGRLDRFAGNGGPVSLYAKEGVARVELVLRSDDQLVSLTRVTDGKNDQFRLKVDAEVFEGAQAEARLVKLILPHLSDRSNAAGAVGRILTRGVYLQQDLIRQFIDSDTAADRFSLISEIIGAGAVIDLQRELERSRLAWSRNTNAVRREQLEPMQAQFSKMQETLNRLDSAQLRPTADIRGEAEDVFNEAIKLLGTGRLSVQAAPTSSSELDRLLKDLSAQRMAFERELATVRALMDELNARDTKSLEHARAQMADAILQEGQLVAELRNIEKQVGTELSRLQDNRQKRISSTERAERLAAMAQIALDELGDACPVCTQPFDKHTTEAHLRALIEHVSSLTDTKIDDTQLLQLQYQLSERTAKLNEVRNRTADLRRQLYEQESQQTLFIARLGDLGIKSLDKADAELIARADQIAAQLKQITEVLSRGEKLTLAIVRLGEERQRSELTSQRTELQQRVATLHAELDAQDRTHALAGRIIDGLRRASLEVTARQVASLGPLLQRIYSRIDPHPTFKVTQIVTELERGKGLLQAGISDPDLDGRMHEVGPILSSSQLNSFAVSLFLALNLGIQSLRLRLSILDDPLQSLDPLNLLGLVDVLRRLRGRRQIIVSTHDDQLLGLLQRKLRPATDTERLIVLRFDRWSKDGPEFRQLQFDYDAAANPRVLLAA